jgi:putative intracellular protease/amidase
VSRDREKEIAMSVKHVLFVLTNAAEIGPNKRPTGFFFPEVAHPWEVFEHAGIAIEYASPLGGKPPEDGYDDSDPAQAAFLGSQAYRRMGRSRRLADVDVLDYDAVFFPGGLGPMVDIATDPDVKRAVARTWDGGKIVAAVCHGPAALLGVTLADGSSLLRGRKVTGFSNAEEIGYADADVPFFLEDALREAGAGHSAASPWQPKVVVDGRLMTGQNPASGGPLAEAIAAALGERP